MVRFIMLAIFLFSAIMPSLAVVPAYACSCAAPIPAQSESNADLIAVGTVVSVDMPSVGAFGTWSSFDPAYVSVAVDRYLKGSGGVDLIFSTARSGASCGALEVLDVGKRYLLFLRADGTNYTTGLCSGNAALDSYAGVNFLREIDAIVGPGIAPDEQPDGPTRPDFEAEPRFTVLGVPIFSLWKVLVAGIAGVLALLAAAIPVFGWGASNVLPWRS